MVPRLRKLAPVLAGAVLLLALPRLIASNYYMRLANLAVLYVLVVTGYNILYGYAGQLSFGHAGFFAIGAYSVGILTRQLGYPPLVGLAAAAIISPLSGILVGIPTLRVRGHYLAVATIAFGEIVRQVILNWEKVTRGYNGITNIRPPAIGPLDFASERTIYYMILFFAVVGVAVARKLRNSTYGRAMVAVKDSELAAEVMGVDTTRIKVLAFALSALYAGIGGALYSYVFGYISPDAFEFALSVNFVAMLMVGGAGSLVGAIIGAITLTFLPEILRIGQRYYMVLYGACFLAILVFLPDGIVGILQTIRRRMARRLPRRGAASLPAPTGG